MTKHIFLLFVFALAGLFAAPAVARACSCLAAPETAESVERRLKDYEGGAIFEGKITKIEKTASGHEIKATFAVERFWRGSKTSRASVFTASDSARCGVPYQVGKRFLVIAKRADDGRFFTYLCDFIAQTEHEAIYRKLLGKGSRPSAGGGRKNR